MYKGADKAMVSLTSYNATGDGFRMDARYNWAEDEHFQKMRIMTSPEAVGHILGFSFWEESVAVVPLPVHAPDDQTIVFQEGGEEEALVNCAKSKLVGFFQLCEDASLSGHPLQIK